jgi:staphyloferrin B biosynthesis citrate synthase
MAAQAGAVTFRDRFLKGDPLYGTFLKTPTTHATEILGIAGYDFVVVDQEHAPFGRESTDAVMLACMAHGIAGVVRVPDASASAILSVLDCGAAGVLVPHVDSPARAAAVVAACRYRGGARGFSNTTRAGGFGEASIGEHIARQDSAVCVIAMIEDPSALDAIDAILATEGLDGVFIGRGDLTVALGETAMTAAPVREATERIVAAARRAGKPVCVMTGAQADARELAAKGVSAFIMSSDQGFLRQAAKSTLAEISASVAEGRDGHV